MNNERAPRGYTMQYQMHDYEWHPMAIYIVQSISRKRDWHDKARIGSRTR